MSHTEGTKGLRRFARNATATALGLLIAGGVYVGTTTYMGQTVEVYDCSPDARGPRVFGAREDPDNPGVPLIANVAPEKLAGRCIRPTPYSWTDSQGRVWYPWLCMCRGQECCSSLDHPQYACSTVAECKAVAKSLGGMNVDKTHLLCALDPAGCSSRDGPEPCRRPVALIPSERRPPEAEWSLCHNWAPRERE